MFTKGLGKSNTINYYLEYIKYNIKLKHFYLYINNYSKLAKLKSCVLN